MKNIALFPLFLCVLISAVCFPPAASGETVLDSYAKIARLYEGDVRALTGGERTIVALHGVRGGVLDARIWGVRVFDRTSNRRLVPMRPYYLRVSEDPTFQLEQLSVAFTFDKETEYRMLHAPALHTPMIEIGFGGQVRLGLPGEAPTVDRSYALRLSAHPEFASGIRYRSHINSIEVAKFTQPKLQTAQRYEVVLRAVAGGVEVLLNSEIVGVINDKQLPGGMLSLQTAWEPVLMHELHVRGSIVKDGKRVPVSAGGLLQLN